MTLYAAISPNDWTRYSSKLNIPHPKSNVGTRICIGTFGNKYANGRRPTVAATVKKLWSWTSWFPLKFKSSDIPETYALSVVFVSMRLEDLHWGMLAYLYLFGLYI